MGLLNSALQIGRSAILSYEGALQTVGNNIAGVGNPDYTRISPELASLQGPSVARGLQPGAGVALTDIQRNIDEALEGRLRVAIGSQQSAEARQGAVAQVSGLFDDLSGSGVGARLNDFFSNFDELQNTPEDSAIRDLTVNAGALLAQSLNDLRNGLGQIGESIDGQIADVVRVADTLAQDIARLNREITTSETGQRGKAAALRDQRDALLRELGQYFDVTVREQPNGSLNVYVGSEALVQGDVSRGLVAVPVSDGEFTRTSVRFSDTNQEVQVGGGRIAGLIRSREQDAYGQVAAVDEFATTLISTVNAIHADGQGLASLRSVVGAVDLLETDEPLNSTASGMPFPVNSGSFYVSVMDDATDTPVAFRVDVDLSGSGSDTTLESLAQSITEQVDGLTATITSDKRLALTADTGVSFVFGFDGQNARSDTSGVLAALGINTFFSGTDATNVAVNDVILQDTSLLAAAAQNIDGDGVTAGRIASLDTVAVAGASAATIPDVYEAIANAVAVSGNSANGDLLATETVLLSLQAQRESVSGVNLDEEAISLVKYEQAFQGAARFISTVDDMITQLLSLLG